MAASKTTKSKAVNTEDAIKKVSPIASAAGKGAKEIWKMFVMRYVAKGVSELFAAGVLTWITYDKLYVNYWVWWILIPFPIALILTFDAIQLLINPAYFALDDVEKALKRLTSKTNEITIFNNR